MQYRTPAQSANVRLAMAHEAAVGRHHQFAAYESCRSGCLVRCTPASFRFEVQSRPKRHKSASGSMRNANNGSSVASQSLTLFRSRTLEFTRCGGSADVS